jgi:hypothetical protein
MRCCVTGDLMDESLVMGGIDRGRGGVEVGLRDVQVGDRAVVVTALGRSRHVDLAQPGMARSLPAIITGASGVRARVGQEDAGTERSGPHHEGGVNGVWPLVRVLGDELFGGRRSVVAARLVDVPGGGPGVRVPGSISLSPTMSRT